MRLGYIGFLFLIIISCSKKDLDLSKPNIPFQISDPNLELKVIAKEPLTIAPIAIDFDLKNRIWVAEMPDYMPDINAEKESIPAGRIVILSDEDEDGYYEESKTFLDKIPQLRAIKLFNNGLLYADDPNLWFVSIEADRAGERTLIDSLYCFGGNVEHKANGLLRNIDNCIYNSKSNFRYCYDQTLKKWSKEPTTFRGQWGITSDENGRLYVNDNSNFFFGDYFLSNTVIQNEFLRPSDSQVMDLVKNRRVFPIKATAINRGYEAKTLDSNGMLINTTSTCGPHIFNSDALGSHYDGKAFICVPEINAIKLLRFDQNEFIPSASFALDSSEFIISEDESFRPVNINTGPDGGLYIVDMHRGIIQHKTYMTNYLRNLIEERGLDTVINYGRILRLSNKNDVLKSKNYNWENEDSLISYLSSDNKWLCDKAQELLIYAPSSTLESKLKSRLLSNPTKKDQIYIPWILHHQGTLTYDEIKSFNVDSDPWAVANVLKIINQTAYQSQKEYLPFLARLSESKNPTILNHLILNLKSIYETNIGYFFEMINKVLSEGGGQILPEAIIAAFPSGVKIDMEKLVDCHPSIKSSLQSKIEEYHHNIDKNRKNSIFNPLDLKQLASDDGRVIYNKSCASCHGIDGLGIKNLAPSLVSSRLINDHPNNIPLIIMHGLEGPVNVNDQIEEFASPMPAFRESLSLSHQQIAKISNYIYNAFGDKAHRTSVKEIEKLDQYHKNKTDFWTEEHLIKMSTK